MYSAAHSKNYSNWRENLNPVDIFFLKQLETMAEGADILDIGCGNGKLLFEIENLRPKRLVGIDNCNTMIDLALSDAALRNSQATLQVMDAENLDFKDIEFDLIVSTFTVHHLLDLSNFFSSINNILRVGGFFIATFNTFEVTDEDLVGKEALIDLRSGSHQVTVSNTIRLDNHYREAAEQAGLQEVTYRDLPNPVPSISSRNVFDTSKISKLNNIYAIFRKS